MTDENQEIQDSFNQPEGESASSKLADATPADDVAKLKHLKDSYYARAKQAEDEAKVYKEKLVALEKKPISAAIPEDLEKKLETIKLVAKGYSDEEAQFVLNAGGPDNPFVKAGIEAMRSKAKVEQAQPSASQVSEPIEVKTENWNKMSFSDRKKTWSDALDRAATRRSGQPI